MTGLFGWQHTHRLLICGSPNRCSANNANAHVASNIQIIAFNSHFATIGFTIFRVINFAILICVLMGSFEAF